MSLSFPTIDAEANEKPAEKAGRPAIRYEPVAFKDLPGWETDEHDKAYRAFLQSCAKLITMVRSPPKDVRYKPDPRLVQLCTTAEMLAGKPSAYEARLFFERHFVPHRVVHGGPKGLLTGYYEPVLTGSRVADARFKTPVYKRPPDLVNLIDESQRGALDGKLTHARQTEKGLVPYATRAEIEQGLLVGQGLELIYLEDPVELFFMQIQGSGRIKLTDGSMIRIGYDGKNGHPYTSIGRVLIEQGEIPVERMSLKALATWLKANIDKAREVMWANKSYIFFREYKGKEAASPQGVHEIPLTPGRSLAVDAGYHAIGLPIYVVAPDLKHASTSGFRRLMVSQDVGSAIKGPERGDIYFGSGDKAGKLAGTTKHPGNLIVLLPRFENPPGTPAAAAPSAAQPGTRVQ
jgi:membrane-bound lytic murein transglycosylase A